MRRAWKVMIVVSLWGLAPSVLAERPAAVSDAARAEQAAAAAWDAAPTYAPAQSAEPAARSPRVTIYSSDFESNNGGLTGTVDWGLSTAYAWTGVNCTGTFVNPPAAHSGTGMWGTVINGCYQNLGNNQGAGSGGTCNNTAPTDDSILTLTVDLTGYTNARLMFWEWYDIFSYYDWTEIRVNNTSVFMHCETTYTAPSAWVQRTVDLTPYVGGVATIEFHMMASTVVNKSGWYIDDVVVDDQPVPVELQSLSIE